MVRAMRLYDNAPAVCFTRRAFEHALWFDWQHYHTGAIQQLVEYGWLSVHFLSNGLYSYTLTETGLSSLAQDFRRMRESVTVFTHDSVPFA